MKAQQTRHPEQSTASRTSFDPAWLASVEVPDFIESHMVEGVKQHLAQYGSHQSIRNTLRRIEDSEWLAAWGPALDTVRGSRVLFHGSELGVFPLRGPGDSPGSEVLIFEQSPLERRVAEGVVQKNLLRQWHAAQGDAIRSWSEEERRASFESFARTIHFMSDDAGRARVARCDVLVLPGIDHTLLGTGVVRAIREHRANGLPADARILPGRARIFAMAIQWASESAGFRLSPLNELRWSPYPQELDLRSEDWIALTEQVFVGEIDFGTFTGAQWSLDLPVVTAGDLDAIVFWFELELPGARLSSAPDSALQCIRPAVQYVDSTPLARGDSLRVRVLASETRLHFEPQPPPDRLRSGGLPSWYVPMLRDRLRNDGYATAIDASIKGSPGSTVLDIGAGCGLLSMIAARAGAARVVGCEVDADIAAAGTKIVALNGLSDVVSIVRTDCRQMKVGEGLPERADLALFEMFDCSLIGEGVLHFLAHARAHLLKEHARYLPRGARIRAMAIEYRLDEVWGHDVNLLNPYRYSPEFINVDARKLSYRALTEPFDVFSFDFATADPTPEERALEIPVVEAGTVGAVLFWFDLQLDDTLWLSNDPTSTQTLHWKQGLQFLSEVITERQMKLPLVAAHNGSSLRFTWQQDGVPKERYSRLPRFDPRLRAEVSRLEQQTHGLLQHCLQNPEEHAKVARLAQCLAIDPASHGLENHVAQRFAQMFLAA